MSVQIPPQAIADARAGAARAGYPELAPVLLALAGPESTWRADAAKVDAIECSYGYLQMNRCGGLGNGHDVAELLDGPSNFALGARVIGDRLAAGASLRDALRDWSTRDQALALLPEIQAALGAMPPAGGDSSTNTGGGLLAVALLALLTIATALVGV